MHGVLAELFSQLTKELCAYLGRVLPRLSDHWWKEHVLANLSFQQVQIVKQHGFTMTKAAKQIGVTRVTFSRVINGK